MKREGQERARTSVLMEGKRVEAKGEGHASAVTIPSTRDRGLIISCSLSAERRFVESWPAFRLTKSKVRLPLL
jgi:hypothetical protein